MKNIDNDALIEKRIKEALSPDFLNIIDESDQHHGHAGYQGGGRHFAVEISAFSLKGLTRVAAHRKIYELFQDIIPDKIHALRIKILP